MILCCLFEKGFIVFYHQQIKSNFLKEMNYGREKKTYSDRYQNKDNRL